MAFRQLFVGWLALVSLLGACRQRSALDDEPAPVGSLAAARGSKLPLDLEPHSAPPLPSEVVAFEKEMQSSKLSVPPSAQHVPRLQFTHGALAQLTHDALVIYDTRSFRELVRESLSDPRAVLALADGGLIAFGSQQLLHWQPGWKHTKRLARPLLLPGLELYADAQQPDRLWVFDGLGSAERPPTLTSYRLVADDGNVPLPEQTIELTSRRGGVLGTTREGVWLYLSSGREERLGPGGARLPGASFAEQPLPVWALPARSLDQSLWIDESGKLSRMLVGSSVRRLAPPLQLPGRPYAVASGDQARLLATVLVTGPGPRFELELRDADLSPLGRVPLPLDPPTGAKDWVKTVTENRSLAAAANEPLVAVGGPARLEIFGRHGERLFPKPSE